MRQLDERNRFVRGLFAWVGFHSTGIEHQRPKRFGGASKAYSLKVIDLAFKGIFAHSYLPLRLITLIGMVLSILSVSTTAVMAIVWFTIGVPFAGFGTLFSLIVLLFGLLFLMMGIVSEYLGLVYEEVKQRPNFVVRAKLGFDAVEDDH